MFILFSVLTYVNGFQIGADSQINAPKTKGDCPKCKKGILCALRSQNIKKCSSCDYEQPWRLNPGQKPLIRNNRHDRKSNI